MTRSKASIAAQNGHSSDCPATTMSSTPVMLSPTTTPPGAPRKEGTLARRLLLRRSQTSLPADDNPDTEAEVRKLVHRMDQLQKDLDAERAKRSALEKELAKAKADMQSTSDAYCILEQRYSDHMSHAQMVLNLRLADHREALEVACCVKGCDDPSEEQSPLMQWACRCTKPRTACMSCIAKSMRMHTCDDGTQNFGFRCPMCTTVATRLLTLDRADAQPEQWRTDYQRPEDD